MGGVMRIVSGLGEKWFSGGGGAKGNLEVCMRLSLLCLLDR